jgi:hypothetical protein
MLLALGFDVCIHDIADIVISAVIATGSSSATEFFPEEASSIAKNTIDEEHKRKRGKDNDTRGHKYAQKDTPQSLKAGVPTSSIQGSHNADSGSKRKASFAADELNVPADAQVALDRCWQLVFICAKYHINVFSALDLEVLGTDSLYRC